MSTGCSPVTSNVSGVNIPRRTFTALLAVALLAATAGACTDSPEESDGSAWEPCPEVPQEAVGEMVPPGLLEQVTEGVTYECTTITVPRDWSEPEGETLDLALLRARSDDQSDRIGSLVVNPGGPGASGVETAALLSFGATYGGLPDPLPTRFDIVGFDPRGVDRSSPVECIPDEALDESFGADPDPTQAEIQEMLTAQERTAQRCGERYGEDLRYYSTHQTARDMEAVREAVGDDQLTYLGFSYGTLLGAVYAHLHPDRVRAMVLDGAVDPAADPVTASRHQAEGFKRAFDNFATWCTGADQGVCPFDDARAAVTAALEEARTSPVTGADGREATAGWVLYAVVSALYAQQSWPALAAAIDQLDTGDPSGVFDLADAYTDRSSDGEYSNMWDASRAISCADGGATVSAEQARQLQQQWREELPLFGPPLALGTLTCHGWPVEPDPYPTGAADGAPPILVVGTTGDPATPYEAAGRLADLLEVGVVLTYEGEGHTAYPGSECVNTAVADYVVDLSVPEEGTTCG